jgi:probable F420-dependent oxidoreductase
LTKTYGDRFPLGIGCSNSALVDSLEPGRFRKPLAATRSFLDALELAVVLTADREEARAIGSDWLRAYVGSPNYGNRLLRSGFTADEVSSVSDRVFDAIIAWGDEEAVLRRVNEHRAAGADHVCVQVLTADQAEFPREQWRHLAAALL